MKHLILFAAVLFIMIAACNKPAEQSVTKVTTSDTMFRVVNNSKKALKVDMYTSYADRAKQTNVVYSCLVPAIGSYKIPFSKLDTTASYFYDVYTSDYLYSNWGNTYQDGNSLFYYGHFTTIDTSYLTQSRYYYLNGNDASSSWRAVDKIASWDGSSQWSTLDGNGRYLRVTVNRDRTGTINYKQSDGTIISENIVQMASNMENGLSRLSLYTSLSSADYVFYNCTILPAINVDHITSKDTVLLDNFVGGYWKMVRN